MSNVETKAVLFLGVQYERSVYEPSEIFGQNEEPLSLQEQLKQAQEALAQEREAREAAEGKLRQANELLSQARQAGHDMNNELGIPYGTLDLVASDATIESGLQEMAKEGMSYFESALASATTMQVLIRDAHIITAPTPIVHTPSTPSHTSRPSSSPAS